MLKAEKENKNSPFTELEPIIIHELMHETRDLKQAIDGAVRIGEKMRAEALADRKSRSYFQHAEGETHLIHGPLTVPERLAYVDSRAVIARLLETLVHEGPRARLYRHLIADENVRQIISNQCDPNLFNKAADRFPDWPIEAFAELCLSDFYLDPDYWQRFRRNRRPLEAAPRILQLYASWWLDGEQLEARDMAAIFAKTGVLDSLCQRSPKDTEVFEAIFRILYLCVHFEAGNGRPDILRPIIERGPARPVDFEALDLWLQRTALIQLIRRGGVDALLRLHPHHLRPFLVHYWIVKENPDSLARNKMKDALLQMGFADWSGLDRECLPELLQLLR